MHWNVLFSVSSSLSIKFEGGIKLFLSLAQLATESHEIIVISINLIPRAFPEEPLPISNGNAWE